MICVTSYTIPDSILGTQVPKVIEYCRKCVKYYREKWPEQDTRCLKGVTGDQSRIAFTCRFRYLADAEQFWKMFWQDSGVKALVVEFAALTKELGAPAVVRPTIT